jgi:hypothetical protein
VVRIGPGVGAVGKALVGEVVEDAFVRILLRAEKDKVLERVRPACEWVKAGASNKQGRGQPCVSS